MTFNNIPKTLMRAIERSGKIESGYKDSDGYWLLCKPGFIGPFGTHELHELTINELLWQFKEIEVCECDECDDNERN
jgi:hypothetical protein